MKDFRKLYTGEEVMIDRSDDIVELVEGEKYECPICGNIYEGYDAYTEAVMCLQGCWDYQA